MLALMLAVVLSPEALQRLDGLAHNAAGKGCPSDARLEQTLEFAPGRTSTHWRHIHFPTTAAGPNTGVLGWPSSSIMALPSSPQSVTASHRNSGSVPMVPHGFTRCGRSRRVIRTCGGPSMAENGAKSACLE